ncbi:MAG: hypothetical protein BMS9Abin05_2394 [Rhodothermia bacterium]|nr:MAG: hypothetical protein BMS9Abin05_2394 [Rhodothermia bacterium]
MINGGQPMSQDDTDKPNGGNGEQPTDSAPKPRVVSDPQDVANLVLMQLDAINTRKDDLTLAIKGLSDLTKQLVRAYAGQAQAIKKLQQRVKELEG